MSSLGKWLQQLPKDSLEQQCEDLANLLRAKEQMLETMSHDLKVKTSAMQILEQKVMSSQTQSSVTQRELTARAERVKALEAEVAAQAKQMTDVEAEGVAARQRVGELNATVTALANELRGAQQACQNAEQAQEVLKEEVRVLRDHIAQLNEGLADRDHFRARVEKLESMQDRVHQLEIELSDRESAHRVALQQLEQSLADRDGRISAFDKSMAVHLDELRDAQQISRAAEQTQAILKEEIRVLRDQITQLNKDLADRDRLRAHLEKLASVQDRVHQLEVELSNREAVHRGAIQQFEQSLAERDGRISEFNASTVAQLDELRGAQQARQTAEHTQEVLKEENRVLRDQIAQLNKDLADRDRLRANLEKLSKVQERVHQLEVELSDREAAHRGTLKQLEQSLAERDRKISKFDVTAAAQMDKLHEVQQACKTAEKAQDVLKEEIRVLRDHIVQLNESLADRDRLRAEVERLAKVQERVHQLEVELSDREAAHRGTLQQFEQLLAERDGRISEFDAGALVQLNELRGAQQACQAAEHAQELLKEEIRALQNHIAQLNEDLADRDKLRTQLKKLEAVQGRVHQLEVELSDREAAHRGILKQLEQSLAERDRKISKFDVTAAAQMDKLHEVQQACKTAEKAQDVLKEEIRVLREQIAQLNENLADRDKLRAQLKKLETLQGRVHQLEIEQSDREAAHRGTLKQLEKTLAERDRRIEELLPTANLLREKGVELKEWEKKHARTIQEHKSEVAQLQEQCAAQERLREQLQVHEQHLQGRDEQIAHLNGQIRDLHIERQNLTREVQTIPGKDEQIDRLQKRLKELRGTLREQAVPEKATPTKTASVKEGPRPARQNGAEPKAPGGQSKIGKDKQEDDLKKIHGIRPAFAQTLYKMGTRTFIQIARWKQEDIEKIAKKLETDPERIKRENWIASAKKQHFQKYGERI